MQEDSTSSHFNGQPDRSLNVNNAFESTFLDLIPQSDLSNRLTTLGYAAPTKTQVKAIPFMRSGRDVILLAGASSGKTLAYGIALGSKIRQSAQDPISLIVHSSASAADEISKRIKSLGLATLCLQEEQDSQNQHPSQNLDNINFVVGTSDSVQRNLAQGALTNCPVGCLILEGFEHTSQAGVLEAILSEVTSSSGQAQLIWVGRRLEPSLNKILNKYFKSPEIIETMNESTTTELKHIYYHVSDEVTAKPRTLCDLLESAGVPPTLIFCNMPSDTDMVEVILRRRGISTRKLIGNVPPLKMNTALRQVKDGEVSVLVITDVAARGIESESFGLLINYGVPSDPEVYLHRMGQSGKGGTRGEIYTLIDTSDVSNFEYLKKFVDFQFVAGTLPTAAELAGIRVKSLLAEALQSPAVQDTNLKSLAQSVLGLPEKEDVLAYLLNNTLNVLPGLRSTAGRDDYSRNSRSDDRRGDDRRSDDRLMNDRRDNRGGRGRGQGGDRRNGSNYEQEEPNYNQDEDLSGGQAELLHGGRRSRGNDRRDDNGRGGRNNFRDRDSRDRAPRDQEPRDRGEREWSDRGGEQRSYTPQPKIARLYVGHGTASGLSEDKIKELVTSSGQIPADKISRVTIRPYYTFVDLPDEGSDTVVSALANANIDGKEPCFVRKAVLLNGPRDENQRDNFSQGQDNYESGAGEDSQSDGAQSEDAGQAGDSELVNE